MIHRIQLTGKQLGTINLRPDIYRKAGAQLMGKELVGSEQHLKGLKKGLEEWLEKKGEVTLEMDLGPILDQIDAVLKVRR
ncbi:MAG: hypothetical protein ACOC2Y_08050 [Spirochaetota bacterium]